MSLKDIAKLDDEELKKREQELRRHLYDLRVQVATDKVKDLSQFGKDKKDIARVLTLLRQRTQSKAAAPSKS
jgi:large subunit ribosomal protein L29